MEKRKILDEYQTRAWFEAFGEELGYNFDEIYGDMDLSKSANNYMFKIVNKTIFIKIKHVIVGYIIIPQLDMFL